MTNSFPTISQSHMTNSFPTISQSHMTNSFPTISQSHMTNSFPTISQSHMTNSFPLIPQSPMANSSPLQGPSWPWSQDQQSLNLHILMFYTTDWTGPNATGWTRTWGCRLSQAKNCGKAAVQFFKFLMGMYFSEEELYNGNLRGGGKHKAINPAILGAILAETRQQYGVGIHLYRLVNEKCCRVHHTVNRRRNKPKAQPDANQQWATQYSRP
ncbi:Hypp6659 [Branchiostoma lanceolatum]|uniref:Hypp6659 protein n=1 Tax=Branchiostoma lanceolatum TaxID=7740 RepID=A0A8K0EAI2_BRALA|nr:Hypp6659 [Branchiostoma lanceolatum]